MRSTGADLTLSLCVSILREKREPLASEPGSLSSVCIRAVYTVLYCCIVVLIVIIKGGGGLLLYCCIVVLIVVIKGGGGLLLYCCINSD